MADFKSISCPKCLQCPSGLWFGTCFFPLYGMSSFPFDELHHFSRWLKHVKTTNQLQMTTCQEPATGLKSSKTPKRACRNRPNPRPILYFMFLINGKPGKPTQRGNLEGIVSMASARSTPSTPYFARDIWSLAHISSICNGGDRPDTFSCSSSL